MKAKLPHKFKYVGDFVFILTFKVGKHGMGKREFFILIISEE